MISRMVDRSLKKDRPFWPPKYYKGLTRKQKEKRRREIQKFGSIDWKSPKAYVGFKTNKGIQTKKSKYTQKFQNIFPDAKSLKQKSEVTGVPLKFIQKSYNRGLAAWRTGHRPGATQQQWGYARVHSFLMCGKTHYGPDSDLAREAIATTPAAKKWFSKC